MSDPTLLPRVPRYPGPWLGRKQPIDQLLDQLDRLAGLPPAPAPPARGSTTLESSERPDTNRFAAAARVRAQARPEAAPPPRLTPGQEARQEALRVGVGALPAPIVARFRAAVAAYIRQRPVLDRLRLRAQADQIATTLDGLAGEILEAAELAGDELRLPEAIRACYDLGASWEALYAALRAELHARYLAPAARAVAEARTKLHVAQQAYDAAYRAAAETRLRCALDEVAGLATVVEAMPDLAPLVETVGRKRA